MISSLTLFVYDMTQRSLEVESLLQRQPLKRYLPADFLSSMLVTNAFKAGHRKLRKSLQKQGHDNASLNCRPSLHSGPAQERYGDYFCQVLHRPELQQRKGPIKMLRQIVFSGFDTLNYKALNSGTGFHEGLGGDENIIPFLVVYQHGHQIWGGYPSTQVGSADSKA